MTILTLKMIKRFDTTIEITALLIQKLGNDKNAPIL